MIARSLTAEDFEASRFELPDDGRWTELLDGRPIVHAPPSPEHGTVVLNLSKALARYLDLNPEGYACFELGLIVAREPDTVLFPAISYFVGGSRFAELDKVITETRPAMLVEVISTADRRQLIRHRVPQYIQWGVPVVLVIDPDDKRVVVHLANQTVQILKSDDHLEWNPDWWPAEVKQEFLEEFRLQVSEIFREPNWVHGSN